MRKAATIAIALLLCTAVQAQREFPYPVIPDSIEENYDRLSWVLENFWEDFDFADDSAENMAVGEQGMVDFITLTGSADSTQTARAAQAFAKAALTQPGDSATSQLYNFIELLDHYLANPKSPMRNDRIYAAMLGALASAPDSVLPIEVRGRLLDSREQAMLNMPGTRANDFTFVDRSGNETSLRSVEAEHIVLYFHDPECEQCISMQQRAVASSALHSSRVKVLHIYPEENTEAWANAKGDGLPTEWVDGRVTGGSLMARRLYWFAQMPSFYLLDSQKRVILKDTTIEAIENLCTKEGEMVQ